ncbi:Holliday junction branch migration protein RuvA [Thiomicrospira sp. ALE5]|uniref:Holliday junction branch migration protein RuvA n=1 Tax=Thiomicrospira sp. ALE5 TaxID=748650 RepID=UPI0008ED30FA|nr:Holliday junction branch migration protein RuvA [Thiomicrospira sp. ALE5]SFR51149.1 Holliday junction DNA helicase subunit RuvA [Thiomicrospira sp. ALE5]
MIGFLHGTLVAKQPPLLLLDVNGVGYELEAPMSTFYALPEGQVQVKVLTHLHVREDAMLLYGFATDSERQLFRELVKVSGIGTKMALAVLSTYSVQDFNHYIHTADTIALAKVPGIGKKTAERMVIEMRDRLQKVFGSSLQATSQSGDTASSYQGSNLTKQSAIAALVSLGYKEAQAESWVNKTYDDSLSLEQVIKQALLQVRL